MSLTTLYRLSMLCACMIMPLSATAAAAGSYPDRPITLVIPYPAGGSTDLVGRLLGHRVSELLKQPVIVENRPGASSNIGCHYVATSKPDGYTILLASSTGLSVNPILYKHLQFNPQKDFAPIILTTTLPNVLVVNNQVSAKTLGELTQYLKQHKNKASFASAGNGTPSHLGGELYKRAAGLKDLIHVPYKGGAPAESGLASGDTAFMFAVVPEAMPLVKDGRMKAIAVTTEKRLPEYPDLPTVAESGMPGFELTAWYGILAPAHTPGPIVNALNRAFNEALKEPAIVNKLQAMSFEVNGGPPSLLADRMRKDTAKWRPIIQEAGITLD